MRGIRDTAQTARQTLLIALDDEKGRDTTHWGSDAGLAGALLLDLARLELVNTDASGKILALDGPQPGHDFLRVVYATIRSSSKYRNAKGWVEHLPHELGPLRQRLARGLVQRGILSEAHSKLLGISHDPLPDSRPGARARPARTAPRRAPRRSRTDRGRSAVRRTPRALGLIDSIVPKDQRRDARKRAKAVAEQGLTGTAVRDAIRAVQAAVIAAIAASTVVSAN